MPLTIRKIPSPNFDHRVIPVEFLVLHYTAVDLQTTLDIFLNPETSVSAHLVIARDGKVYEMVNCLEGKPHRAWHAGVSYWQEWQAFNDFSIGIELVNYNGNVFDYSEQQYASLQEVVARLKAQYPALLDPCRVLGHEHIAGHRGKTDPGVCFDWHRFYTENYPEKPTPGRTAICSKSVALSLKAMAEHAPENRLSHNKYWSAVSSLAETALEQKPNEP